MPTSLVFYLITGTPTLVICVMTMNNFCLSHAEVLVVSLMLHDVSCIQAWEDAATLPLLLYLANSYLAFMSYFILFFIFSHICFKILLSREKGREVKRWHGWGFNNFLQVLVDFKLQMSVQKKKIALILRVPSFILNILVCVCVHIYM